MRVVAGVLILVGAVGPAAYPEVSVHLVKDITPGPDGSDVSILGSANGQVLFTTSSGIWRSNGAAGGTVLLTGFTLGRPSYLTCTAVVGNSIFFMDVDVSTPTYQLALCRTDAVNGGKVTIATLGDWIWYFQMTSRRWMVAVNGILFFDNVPNSFSGDQLWRSDGSEAGTYFLHNSFDYREDLSMALCTVIGDTLYLRGSSQLWKTDGTVAGTVLVKQFSFNPSYPAFMASGNGVLFFYAPAATTGAVALWRSDGTEAGTVPIKDGMPKEYVYGDAGLAPVAVNGTVYFPFSDGVNAWKLWKTDGTPANTEPITGFGQPTDYWLLASFTVVGDYVYFITFEALSYQIQLWRSDGTSTGTIMLKDFSVPSTYARLGKYRAVNGSLYFEAEDADHGIELWTSQGTASSTRLLADICPGSQSSEPSGFTGVDDTVFFVADDGVHGYELWAYGPERSGPTAGFSASPLSGDAPLDVEFTDESTPGTGVITHWQWDFGDGATSTQQNPSHTYMENGAYAVSLTVTSTYATDVKTRSWFVDVGHSLPVADDAMAVAAMLAAVALAGAFAMRRTCFP